MLDTVTEIPELRARVRAWKQRGERVAFVPTMGYLHEGHLSLVRLARRHGERVVVSIFVNPAQFNDRKDFESYPIDIARDSELLVSAGCDLLFLPGAEQIYGRGYLTGGSDFQSWVTVERLTAPLEGAFRPGHFRGVTTVVSMLFNLVQPDAAVFGEKDFQQLRVIEQMVEDLHIPVSIVRGPLVREPDGLAMSSRNVRLARDARRQALAISRALNAGADAFAAGERRAGELEAAARAVLTRESGIDVEYVSVALERTLLPVELVTGPARLLIAAQVGGVRLIDNVALVEPPR